MASVSLFLLFLSLLFFGSLPWASASRRRGASFFVSTPQSQVKRQKGRAGGVEEERPRHVHAHKGSFMYQGEIGPMLVRREWTNRLLFSAGLMGCGVRVCLRDEDI